MSDVVVQGMIVVNPEDVPSGPHWVILQGPFSDSGVSYPNDPLPQQFMRHQVFTDERLFEETLKGLIQQKKSVVGLKVGSVYVPTPDFIVIGD